MRKKRNLTILVILGVIVAGGIAYAAIKNDANPKTQPKTQEQLSVGGAPEASQTVNDATKSAVYKRLFFRLNSTGSSLQSGKQVTELKAINLDGSNKKTIFTDVDEDFQIRLFGDLTKNSILAFATPLNEMMGAVWQIQTDGSGTKKQILDSFSSSSFASNNDKIAFVSYNNIEGKYSLWIMNMDGKSKKSILDSDGILSDPTFLANSLSIVKMSSDGSSSVLSIGLDGSGQKEIIKSANEQIFSLSYGNNKLAYIKAPKETGKENMADVYVYDLVAETEKRITNDKIADSYPVLSADGTKIAFDKNGKIWVGASDGSNLKTLVDGTQPIGFSE